MAGSRLRRALWAPAALAAGVLFAFPLLALLAGSLRSPGLAPPLGAELLPATPGLAAYERAFAVSPLGRALANSLLVAAIFVPVAVLTASWAGYALVRLGGRAGRLLVAALALALLVPAGALWVPRFALYDALGLTGGYVPLLLPALMGASPLLVLLFALAFRRLPRDVLDAARVEGASEWRAWRTVAMPLARRTTVAAGLLAFALSWGSFVDPLLYLTDERTFTAPLVLRGLQRLGPGDWSTILAAAAVVSVPVVAAVAVAVRRVGPGEGAAWGAR